MRWRETARFLEKPSLKWKLFILLFRATDKYAEGMKS